MCEDIKVAIDQGILTPITKLRLSEEKDTDVFKEGLVSGDSDLFCNIVNDCPYIRGDHFKFLRSRIRFFSQPI